MNTPVMKSKLIDQIKQAEHFWLIGPQSFSYARLEKMHFPERSLFIYVDGGLNHKREIKSKKGLRTLASLSVGDNDSAIENCDVLKKNQDRSDLHFALSLIKKYAKNVRSLKLYGFLKGSKRPDHLLINIGEVEQWCCDFPQKKFPLISFEERLIYLPPSDHTISINGLFSIMSFCKNKISISGKCEFAFTGDITPFSSQGLSNKGFGDVRIKASRRFILFLE